MAYEGSQRLGELFKSRREKGKSGLPTLSVTLNNGLVDRDSLGRKTDTSLADDEHLLVRKGDIAYNMMRMWQGASGLAEKDGLVSPAYVVLAPKAGIDSRYAAYLFKTQRMIYLFWAYSYGLTDDRLRLYYNDFARIPISTPDVSDQVTISKILSLWDNAIELTEKLVANSKAQRRALMQQLLSGAKRLHGFRGHWKQDQLGSMCKCRRGYAYSEDEYSDRPTNLPFLTIKAIEKGGGTKKEGLKYLVGEVDDRFTVRPGDIVFAITDLTRTAEIAGAPIKVPSKFGGRVAISLDVVAVDFEQGYLPDYIYYALQTHPVRSFIRARASGSTVLHLDLKGALKAPIQLPPNIEEQKAIAAVLACADRETSRLEEICSKLSAERSDLMQRLLYGKCEASLDGMELSR